jgi:outer membrane protein assembly factor BamE (lipoprotein component of BamABCDE complex)
MNSSCKLLGIACFIIFLSCSNSNGKIKKQFNQIKVGMTKEEVIQILGVPAHFQTDSNDNKKIYYYYSNGMDTDLSSSLPTVIFDSLERVQSVRLGDGG